MITGILGQIPLSLLSEKSVGKILRIMRARIISGSKLCKREAKAGPPWSGKWYS